MSVYVGDPRVVLDGDGTATIGEGAPGEGGWTVRGSGGRWVAENPVQGRLPDSFRTCDEGIAAIIGDPQ